MSIEKPFQGFATFLKSPIRDASRIPVFGVPHDLATSFRPGARMGPKAIRQASMMLTDGEHPKFGIDPATVVSDFGDIPVSNVDLRDSLKLIEQTAFATQGPALWMGGDHSMSLGILRGLKDRMKDGVLLHFDAHCDTWKDHFGDPIGHGTWVRNVVEEGIVKPENVLQVGLRSPVDKATRLWLPMQGGAVMTARDALHNTAYGLFQMLLDRLETEDEIPFNGSRRPRRPLYISFDIDALDPAYAPGTGTPEIAGLTPHYVLEFLEMLSEFKEQIVGFDLVEVSPAYDHAGITALAGATLLWTMAAILGSP